jgi:hypothetical protein
VLFLLTFFYFLEVEKGRFAQNSHKLLYSPDRINLSSRLVSWCVRPAGSFFNGKDIRCQMFFDLWSKEEMEESVREVSFLGSIKIYNAHICKVTTRKKGFF